MSRQNLSVIDYREIRATDSLLPQPASLSSSGWNNLHLEVFRQPKFEIAEHHHTMHVLACGLPDSPKTLEQESQLGTGERWLDGKLKRESRKIGDIAIIPAGIAHRCNWNSSVQFMVLAIEPLLLQQVGQDWVDPDRIELMPQFMTQQDALIQGILASLRAEVETGGIGSHLLVDSLKTAIAVHLLRQYCTTKPKLLQGSGGFSQAKLMLVTDYINDHLQQDLQLAELSQIVQLSPYYFLRLFKQKMGITPHQYILQQRVEMAKHLLRHTDLSIAAIAVRTGFCDQSHLTRCFKRSVGLSPKRLQSLA